MKPNGGDINRITGCGAVWSAHSLWERGAVGSNPTTWTNTNGLYKE